MNWFATVIFAILEVVLRSLRNAYKFVGNSRQIGSTLTDLGEMKTSRARPCLAVALSIVLIMCFTSMVTTPFVQAADPGHPASSISAGTFESGNFTFPDNLTITDYLIVDTDTLYVDSLNNRVGIGTASPTTNLNIKGSLDTTLTGTINTSDTTTVANTSDDLTSEISTGDAIKIVNASDSSDFEIFTVNAVTSTNLTLDSTPGKNWTEALGYKDSDLFRIDDGDGTGKLIVDKTGYVGIGTTSPDRKLQISDATNPLISIIDSTSSINTIIGSDDSQGFVGTLTNNDLHIRTDNTARIAIDTSGHVGIGTTDPNYLLEVADGTEDAVNLSGVLYVNDTSNNVGIGTTSPTAKVQIHNSVTYNFADTLLYGDRIALRMIDFPTGGGWARSLLQWENNSGTVLTSLGAYGVNNTFEYGYIGTAYNNYSIRWYPNNYVSLMGKVGIGTTTPQELLEIAGTTTKGIILRSPITEAVGNGGIIRFLTGTGAAGDTNQIAAILSVITQADPSALKGDLTFHVNTGDSSAEKMRITSAGNVGIGTTDPQEELDVVGDVNATGDINASGDVCVYGGNCLSNMGSGDGDLTDVFPGYGITVENQGGPSPRVNLSSSAAGDGLDYSNGVLTFDCSEATDSASDGMRCSNEDLVAGAGDGLSANNTDLEINQGEGVGILADILHFDCSEVTDTANDGVTCSTEDLVIGAGNGLTANNTGLEIDLYTGSGLIVDATGLSMNRSCSSGQVLKWVASGSFWNCTEDSGLGSESDTLQSVTDRGNTTTQPLTIDSDSDEQTNIANTLYVNGSVDMVGIGTASPSTKLDVNGSLNVNGNITMPYAFFIGNGAQASGSDSVAIGRNAQAVNTSSIAVGYQTEATGQYGIAMGQEANTTRKKAVAIGYKAEAKNTSAIAMGYEASATGFISIAIGGQAQATGVDATALGRNAEATGQSTTAVGRYAEATGWADTALGSSANATGGGATALGIGTDATALDAIALGRNAQATGEYATALGRGTKATANYAIAIGPNTNATHDNSVALGRDAATTATNQFMVGSSGYNLDTFVYGNVTPAVNDTYSLGTPDLIWEHGYFGSNSIYIGGIKLSVESGELMWDDDQIEGLWTNSSGNVTLATGNVGIGDSNPDSRLEVLDTTGPQFRITHTKDTDYGDFAVDSDGNLTISSSSGNVFIQLG